jgi:hypothetical protein
MYRVIRILIDAGAEKFPKDKQGKDALYYLDKSYMEDESKNKIRRLIQTREIPGIVEAKEILDEKFSPELVRGILKGVSFGKSRSSKKRSKKPKKVDKRLKSEAKKLKIRLTVTRNGKRIPKSRKVLREQVRRRRSIVKRR